MISPNNLSYKKSILITGIVINLGLLGYFKYANFLVNEFNWLFGTNIYLSKIILPLAISFFTFQQIAYLVDAYKGYAKEYNFLQYCLFVTFFPQLIAGPIVHHKEMLPQFTKVWELGMTHKNMAIGITIFFIGLFKKVIIADNISVYSTPVFSAAEVGVAFSTVEAWVAALAYTFQLYFDFSGYSDMAIGLARMFGIRLPLNFNSPYKAKNIIEFWRRWHITLSRFLRDYLYIPLGGNRNGVLRRHINIVIVMILGGLWHGAGWSFVFWGTLHGIYIVINHGWHELKRRLGFGIVISPKTDIFLARFITFLAVVVGWVFFRAESYSGALNILSAMFFIDSVNKISVLNDIRIAIQLEILLLFVVWYMPNTQSIMYKYKPAFETYLGEVKECRIKLLRWKPNYVYGLITSIAIIIILNNMFGHSEFLYFNF